jgi:cyclopropane-fatty-acyl-phospholipid synthase
VTATSPLRDALADALPERPFTVRFWDGASLPSTNGSGGPTFTVRSPLALSHMLRSPGQLGLGRAYVSGELAVDDIDKVIELLATWQPPPVDRAAQARLALAAAQAAGIQKPPTPPRSELRPRG